MIKNTYSYMYNLTVHFSIRHVVQKCADNNGGGV